MSEDKKFPTVGNSRLDALQENANELFLSIERDELSLTAKSIRLGNIVIEIRKEVWNQGDNWTAWLQSDRCRLTIVRAGKSKTYMLIGLAEAAAKNPELETLGLMDAYRTAGIVKEKVESTENVVPPVEGNDRSARAQSAPMGNVGGTDAAGVIQNQPVEASAVTVANVKADGGAARTGVTAPEGSQASREVNGAAAPTAEEIVPLPVPPSASLGQRAPTANGANLETGALAGGPTSLDESGDADDPWLFGENAGSSEPVQPPSVNLQASGVNPAGGVAAATDPKAEAHQPPPARTDESESENPKAANAAASAGDEGAPDSMNSAVDGGHTSGNRRGKSRSKDVPPEDLNFVIPEIVERNECGKYFAAIDDDNWQAQIGALNSDDNVLRALEAGLVLKRSPGRAS